MGVGVDRGGSDSWSKEMDEVGEMWETDDTRCRGFKAKPAERPYTVRPRFRMRKPMLMKSRRRNRPVILKKQTTYPHLVKLEDWLTWKKEHDVVERLASIKAHLGKEDIRWKTRIAGEEVEEMEEADLVTMVSKTDSGPEIVRIKEGGETQYFVVVLNLGPNNLNCKFTPWVGKEQTKENSVGGQLRGVEQEVINL